MSKSRLALMLAIAGGACGAASAQPYLINISGATLLRSYVSAPASTNDFVDVDNDGLPIPGGLPDQLAPFDVTPPYVAGQWWQVQYRAVGSVNGFQELVDFGRTYAVGANNVEIRGDAAADNAFNNRTVYVNAGVPQFPPAGVANAANPGAAPSRSLSDGSFLVTTLTDPATTGILIDVAPIDVPSTWAIQYAGTPAFNDEPGDPGYGTNPRDSVNKDGTPANFNHLLVNAQAGNINFNYASPDANTIYDTQLAWAPIAPVVNFGVGRTQITVTELQHLNNAGRLPNGENLTFVTRDVGSGTRNGFCNTTCTDPSWGVGENIGNLSNTGAQDILGPNYRPSNKGGNSRLINTVINTRIGIGYAGAERGVADGWLTATPARADFLAVRNDVAGSAVFARPNINNVLDNTIDGFNIGGPAVLSSFGDPLAEPAGFPGFGDNNGNPRMRNQQAAAYLNNISRSIAAFTALPGGDPTVFSPGEFAATQFILGSARDFVLDANDPCAYIANPAFSAAVQNFTRTQSVLANPVYNAFNATSSGIVPTRTTNNLYSDGVANGANYITQSGAAVSYGSALSSRNKIAGDFNNDGQRNNADVAGMIDAWLDRFDPAAPVWEPGSNAIIEVLGDFNGDGNFNAADVRYFADGLAIVSGALNRKAGFTAVDTEFAASTMPSNNNFFGTTLANGTYTAGDSRADVIGASGLNTRNWAPTGSDGAVNALDIDYVYDQFLNANITDGAANWSNLAEAVFVDLSADINGDLVIDQCDVTEIVRDILETSYGDADLNGVVNAADLVIVNTNFNAAGGWAQGDFNGNGTVDAQDRQWVRAIVNLGDENEDGSVNFTDLNRVLGAFGTSCPPAPACGLPAVDCVGDENEDGVVNFNDLNRVLGAFGTTYNP